LSVHSAQSGPKKNRRLAASSIRCTRNQAVSAKWGLRVHGRAICRRDPIAKNDVRKNHSSRPVAREDVQSQPFR
jgi:hypothetical protein